MTNTTRHTLWMYVFFNVPHRVLVTSNFIGDHLEMSETPVAQPSTTCLHFTNTKTHTDLSIFVQHDRA